MSAPHDNPSVRVMDRIDEEKARERSVRLIARIAWAATFLLVAAWIVLTAIQIRTMSPMMGGMGTAAMLGIATPVLFVLFGLSVLIAR